MKKILPLVLALATFAGSSSLRADDKNNAKKQWEAQQKYNKKMQEYQAEQQKQKWQQGQQNQNYQQNYQQQQQQRTAEALRRQQQQAAAQAQHWQDSRQGHGWLTVQGYQNDLLASAQVTLGSFYLGNGYTNTSGPATITLNAASGPYPLQGTWSQTNEPNSVQLRVSSVGGRGGNRFSGYLTMGGRNGQAVTGISLIGSLSGSPAKVNFVAP